MAWACLVIGLVLGTVGVLGVRSRSAAARRLLRSDPVRATVLAAHAGKDNGYPPYGAWEVWLELSYELDGKVRKKTLWLEKTHHADYQPGQQIEVFVSERFPYGVRTEAEANAHAGIVTGLFYLAGGVGGWLAVLGFIWLVTGR